MAKPVVVIGAGLAGGDWNKIESIIKEEIKDVDIYIYKFKR
jgi:cell division GTPase FtsZ